MSNNFPMKKGPQSTWERKGYRDCSPFCGSWNPSAIHGPSTLRYVKAGGYQPFFGGVSSPPARYDIYHCVGHGEKCGTAKYLQPSYSFTKGDRFTKKWQPDKNGPGKYTYNIDVINPRAATYSFGSSTSRDSGHVAAWKNSHF